MFTIYSPSTRPNKSLVGGFNRSEKYESQLGWWMQPNINGKIKFMATKPPTRSPLILVNPQQPDLRKLAWCIHRGGRDVSQQTQQRQRFGARPLDLDFQVVQDALALTEATHLGRNRDFLGWSSTREMVTDGDWTGLTWLNLWTKKKKSDFSSKNDWLVVWTPLKNISQLGWLFPIYGKIKTVPNHQPDEVQWIVDGIIGKCDRWTSDLNPKMNRAPVNVPSNWGM